MKDCNHVQAGFTDYLDGQLNGSARQKIDAHLRECRECAREWKSLCDVQASLAELGPVPEPTDLPLRIRVAISQERARSRRRVFAGWGLAWKNTVGPFLLQASAGFCSAVLLLGTVIVLITMFAQPESAQATPDEPLGNATAPRLLYFSNAPGNNEMGAIAGPVVVEVYVNGQGEAWADSGWANMEMSTMTVPNSSTALQKPALACKRNGPTVFCQARPQAAKTRRRLRARS